MVMDAPLVLDTLCLAIYSQDEDVKPIIKTVIGLYEEAVKRGELFNDTACKLYINILSEVLNSEMDMKNDAELSSLLLHFKADKAVQCDPTLLEHLQSVIGSRSTVGVGRIRSIKHRIQKNIMLIKGNYSLKQLFRLGTKASTSTDPEVQDNVYLKMIDEARQLVAVYESRAHEDKTTIEHIDMTCLESVRNGLASYKSKRGEPGYRLGIQQFGKMFGAAGGPLPGYFVGFAALSHHYKSGILMDFCRWIAQYNIPKKKTNKPAVIIFISFENEIYENMMMWFSSAYYNTFHKKPVGLTDEEITSTIVQLYKKNGFELQVYRENGDSFGYEQWLKLHKKWMKTHEIVASFTDYIGKMDYIGSGSLNPADAFQEMVGKIKNFGAHHNFANFSGFQLNGAAEELVSSKIPNSVKRMNASHLATSKGAKREMDVLIYLVIEENHMGQKFLTAWLDKLKYGSMPPEKDRYAAIPFPNDPELLGLVDDIYSENSHVPDIYNIMAKESTLSQSNELF